MWEELDRVGEGASSLAQAPVWSLTDEQLCSHLDRVHAAEQALAAARLHLLAELSGREVPAHQGVASTASWLQGRLHIAGGTASQWVEVAAHLTRRPGLDDALVAGAVNVDQAKVIGAAVAALPTNHVGPPIVDKAEAMLVAFAADYPPRALATMGQRILWHVAPELAEKVDEAALRRQDDRATITRALTLTPTGDGRTRVSGWLDAESAAVVTAALDPLCSPRTRDPEDKRTVTQRRADALREVCALALRTDTLPDHGGERPQLVVTVPFDVLSGQLGAGMLDTGEMLTPEQVRRLACEAAIIPAVLGGDGQVLDLGKSRRLFTGAVRRALVLRDGGCSFPGCTRPPRWCDGHHIVSAFDGGPTSVDNGRLLCGHHHRVVHHEGWKIQLGPDRRPEFIPPSHVDPTRRPRRNIFHRRP
jgi:Domain of unknown function (DUF222)